jgi:putative membrane protein
MTIFGESPLELFLVALPAAWYAIGLRAMWTRAGVGRGVSRLQAISFGAGLLVVVVALSGPVDEMSDALFSAHMVQHLALILVAAPLCVFGVPMNPMLMALPRENRRAAARWWKRNVAFRAAVRLVTAPAIVFLLHMVAMWFWHFPGPYQMALRNPAIHAAEHLSFFGTALLFWWIVAAPSGPRRASEGAAILMVAGTLMQSGVLGALLMFASTAWYPAHAAGAQTWGMTPLEDQQLAGLIMWVPAGLVYVAAVAWLFLRWMRRDERRTAALAGVVWLAAGCAAGHPATKADRYVEGGDAARGKATISAYGCGSCHSIPGIRDADGLVGPPLDHWSERRIIAGEVPNDPERLITWITVPQSIEPGTAMPNMGVTDGQARDIAAYLYTLH